MKQLFVLICCSIVLASCTKGDKFVIEGKFENASPDHKVYLYELDKANPIAVDSTVLSEKGEFKFSHKTVDVNFFKITSGNNEYMVVAKNGDDVKINADLSDPAMSYSLSGAEDADKLQLLNVTKNKAMASINGLQQKFDAQVAAQPDKREAILEEMRPAYTREIETLNKEILKFAQNNTESLAGFYAINLLNPAEYEAEMVAFADKIKSNFNKNPAVTEFIVRMANLKTVQVGQMAPAFTMDNLEGGKISLADFKGKYVLLDFWASWCQPCRQENPNLVKAYQTYKDKNFTIFGVSLDKDAAAWKQAVHADQLAWPHGSELLDFQGPTVQKYQIEAIPSSFLIDPQGKIIAKNLRGEELQAFLAKTIR